MIPSGHKQLYSRFLHAHGDVLHFAAHSHHFWPDVSRDAQLQYWDDSAKWSDQKWSPIFDDVLPRVRAHIARMLELKDSNQIALAPNTHELSARLLSLFLGRPQLSILTTGSEFHSWGRQLLRLQELPQVSVTSVPTGALLKERKKFLDALIAEVQKGPDIFFLSQVFFDSGLALSCEEIYELRMAAPSSTLMVVDGYHAFGALPLDLSRLEGKIFYLGGGYKYAQAGEGVGFMVVPQGEWRPAYTGWFAEFAELSHAKGSQVGYADDGMAFMGATQDSSGFYRFNAVWDQFSKLGISMHDIHQHVVGLQRQFLDGVPAQFYSDWSLTPLVPSKLDWHGHFLTFEASSEADARSLQEALKHQRVLIDRRGQRLRFGFGLYQDPQDVANLLSRLPARQ
jgi:selenocysteine lyase/cysteine desulfurase